MLCVNRLTDSDVAWSYAVAAGWLALAAVYRDALMIAAGVALDGDRDRVVAVGPGDAGLWAQLPLALMLIGIGLAGRARGRP